MSERTGGQRRFSHAISWNAARGPSTRRRALGILAGACAVAAGLAVGHGASPPADAQTPSRCAVSVNKVAAPPVVLLGDTVRVTLTLSATCPTDASPVDVMLVIDESASMRNDGKLDNAKAAAKAFLDAVTLDPSRVGLVAFNDVAGLHSPLTTDRVAVESAIENLVAGGRTNVSGGISLAQQELDRAPTTARRAMVVLTDGYNTAPGAEPIPDAAARAHAAGITVAAVCAGGQCDPDLPLAASEPGLYYDVPDSSQLPDLYRQLAGTFQTNKLIALTVRDEIPANMTYVNGSAVPPPTRQSPRLLEWDFTGPPPAEGITYELRPTETGLHPTNVVATGTYRDSQGGEGAVPFPVPRVRVISSPDCVPQPLEVFFLIDDSNCLYGQSLNDMPAREAIKIGIGKVMEQLEPGVDHAAVIGFGDRALIFQTLTDNRKAVLDAVDRVAMRDSSARLDLAFQATAREMETDRHDPLAQVVTIIITDGPMMPIPDLAENQAAVLRRMGVKHYAIGVGFVSQHATLRAVAEPNGYYEVEFGGDVISLYEKIGDQVTALVDECDSVATPTTPPERGFEAWMPWAARQ